MSNYKSTSPVPKTSYKFTRKKDEWKRRFSEKKDQGKRGQKMTRLLKKRKSSKRKNYKGREKESFQSSDPDFVTLF